MTRVAVIGGGAAGFFFALNYAGKNQHDEVVILEKSPKLLEKVRISGGGRCNVTHGCFDAKTLTKNYPRGEKELLGPFHFFNPAHTVEWFKERGVELKTEDDGRMFPLSDKSETIIRCFLNEAEKHNIKINTLCGLHDLQKEGERWKIITTKNDEWFFDKVIITAGSSLRVWECLKKLGHTIVEPVPSLFTFNVKNEVLSGLQGLSVANGVVKIPALSISQGGAVLITHWGLSGPGILKLSAWCARGLYLLNYRFEIEVNWCGMQAEYVQSQLLQFKNANGRKQVSAHALFSIPLRLWKNICAAAGIGDKQNAADMTATQIEKLVSNLCATKLMVSGKSTNKDEFVTAGGIELSEVNFKTMESKLYPNLFFAGEVLNIDAITGGFNFQAAWTTAWIAAQQ